MGQFSNQLRQAVELAKGKLDETVSSTVVLIAQQLVQRSPVGNPDLWKANSKASARRETYNTTVDAYNAETGSKVRRKSVKGLRKSFPNVAGNGYTGGRFRANWQIGVGRMDTTTTEDTDAGGGKTLQRLSGEASRLRAGHVVVISNSLPYAQKLENGHSRQSPQGFVRLTVADLPALMQAHLRAISSN